MGEPSVYIIPLNPSACHFFFSRAIGGPPTVGGCPESGESRRFIGTEPRTCETWTCCDLWWQRYAGVTALKWRVGTRVHCVHLMQRVLSVHPVSLFLWLHWWLFNLSCPRGCPVASAKCSLAHAYHSTSCESLFLFCTHYTPRILRDEDHAHCKNPRSFKLFVHSRGFRVCRLGGRRDPRAAGPTMRREIYERDDSITWPRTEGGQGEITQAIRPVPDWQRAGMQIPTTMVQHCECLLSTPPLTLKLQLSLPLTTVEAEPCTAQ